MAPSTTRTPLTIGDYVIVDNTDYGYATKIDESLRILSIFNSITNVTRISVLFTNCRPTTMANETRLHSGNNRHDNTTTITPPRLVTESQSKRQVLANGTHPSPKITRFSSISKWAIKIMKREGWES